MAHTYFAEQHNVKQMVKDLQECSNCSVGLDCEEHKVKKKIIP